MKWGADEFLDLQELIYAFIHTRIVPGPSNFITGTVKRPLRLSESWDILPQNN